jgi:hypothetical protein
MVEFGVCLGFYKSEAQNSKLETISSAGGGSASHSSPSDARPSESKTGGKFTQILNI